MKDRYYDVREYGAAGNGIVNDQTAIQKTIDVCHAEGGGIVLLSKGKYMAGTIRIKSNVFIEIDGSASLEAYGDINSYADDTHYNRYRNDIST